jgi:hypothetical protein
MISTTEENERTPVICFISFIWQQMVLIYSILSVHAQIERIYFSDLANASYNSQNRPLFKTHFS